MTRTMQPGRLHSPLRLKLATAFAAVVLIGMIAGGTRHFQQAHLGRMAIPDEKAVAAALLAEKLSGPGYFAPSPMASNRVLDARDGKPYLSAADAHAQVDRIVAERKLDAELAARLHPLIDRLSEASSMRMVGEPSVNLLRLNLALDELR